MGLYILQDNQNRFLDKAMNWVGACPADQLFRARHRDEALNLLIELNAKDIGLRARVVACEEDNKGRPRLAGNSRAETAAA